MAPLIIRKLSKTEQYVYSILLILAVSTACFVFSQYTGYHTAALLLLVTVSLIAMFGDIYPVILAAVLSALIWNFFFIPPLYTFHIGKSEDILMFLMYFVIALLNAVLTIKIRLIEKNAQIREEKEKFLQIYTNLLTSLSRELRNPIATIIGAADNLKNNSENPGISNTTGLVSEIASSSLRLNRYVDNMLVISQLESDTLVLSNNWCDINELAHKVTKRLKETEVKQHIDIEIADSLPYFFIDPVLMELVLNNLIHNAVNYTPSNTTITVRASCIIDQLVIIVEDEGNGFPGDLIYEVFNRDYRLNASLNGGAGLGLAVVKGIVESHRGTVSIRNKNEGGTMITLSIPAKISYNTDPKYEIER